MELYSYTVKTPGFWVGRSAGSVCVIFDDLGNDSCLVHFNLIGPSVNLILQNYSVESKFGFF